MALNDFLNDKAINFFTVSDDHPIVGSFLNTGQTGECSSSSHPFQ